MVGHSGTALTTGHPVIKREHLVKLLLAHRIHKLHRNHEIRSHIFNFTEPVSGGNGLHLLRHGIEKQLGPEVVRTIFQYAAVGFLIGVAAVQQTSAHINPNLVDISKGGNPTRFTPPGRFGKNRFPFNRRKVVQRTQTQNDVKAFVPQPVQAGRVAYLSGKVGPSPVRNFLPE